MPSRGGGRGRGGSRGGRGRGPSGTHRIAGFDLVGDAEIQLNDRPQPTPLFPEPVYKIVPPKPLSQEEKLFVANYRSLREKMRQGPYYAVLGEDSRIGKSLGAGTRTASVAPSFDPFEGMETYGQRYLQKKRRAPRLDPKKFILDLFPSELWSTIDPSYTASNSIAKAKMLELSIHSQSSATDKLAKVPKFAAVDDMEVNKDDEDEDEAGPKPVGDDEDSLPLEGAEVDDNFEDDEEDLGDDYNAEQYFDDGGEDGGDDYDGGDGGGGGGGDYD